MENNAPNVFEQMDKEEQLYNELQKRRKTKIQRNNTSIAIAVICCLVGVALGFLVSKFGFFPPQEKTFTSYGISVTLTDEFREKSYPGFQVAYATDDIIFAANGELKSVLSNINVNNLQNYIMKVLELSDIDSTVNSYDFEGINFKFAEYQSIVEEESYSYLLVVFEGESKYYTINFGCRTKDYSKYENQFFEWAKQIRVE